MQRCFNSLAIFAAALLISSLKHKNIILGHGQGHDNEKCL
jgi:hypothetical protein